jgi:hypothetical protein
LGERENEARESWESAFCGELLEAGVDHATEWDTADQFFARLKANGVRDVSERQVERWRGEGLLPSVRQDPLKYHGSVTYYPPGYCEQVLAVDALLKEKRKFEHVGWELWLRRFPVDEKHWRPELLKAAKMLDRHLKFVRSLIARDENSNSDETIFDRFARSKRSNIILSWVYGRLQRGPLAIVLRVLLETANGQFDGFEPRTQGETRTDDEIATGIKQRSCDETHTLYALDLNQSDKHAILGIKFKFTDALPFMLHDLSVALRRGTLVEALKCSELEIFNARNDVSNGLRIAAALYETMQWIYGSNAFGLRMAAWLAKKINRQLISMFILGWIKLRKVSNNLLSSGDIALLADKAEKIRDQSRQMRALAQTDQRFAAVFSPRRVRKAFKDKLSFGQFMKEIEAANR